MLAGGPASPRHRERPFEPLLSLLPRKVCVAEGARAGDSRHLVHACSLQDGNPSQSVVHDPVRAMRSPLQLSSAVF